MTTQDPRMKMPTWLLYGLIAEGALIVIVIGAVMTYVVLK
jgi:hypothetical protein